MSGVARGHYTKEGSLKVKSVQREVEPREGTRQMPDYSV